MVQKEPFLVVCCEKASSFPSKYHVVVTSISFLFSTVQARVTELPCTAVALFSGRIVGGTAEK